MADVISRLKLESGEFDSKIKRAAQGIQRMAEECHNAGGILNKLEDENRKYIQSIGQMETVSKTARGSVAELTAAFMDMKHVYNQLSQEEKNGEIGQELNKQLEILKQRINDGNQEIREMQKELNGGGGLKGTLDAVAGKFGLNISQLTKFGSVLGVTSTAVQVAKDAFFQSESGIDEWGRTVEGAKGAYNIFLDTLNNGNWSNFFENLQAAIKGGRDLYDVFDRLGSIKSNNAAAIAIVQQQIAQLRLAKQQGENVDAQLKDATARLAQLQKQSITAGKAAGSKSAFEVIRNGVNSVGGAGVNDATINYVIDRIMKNGQSEFDKFKNNYQILQQKGMVTRTQTINDSQGGTYERQYKVFDINALTKEQQKQYSLAKAITEGETRIQKGIAAYAQAVQEGTASAREEFKGNRYALQGTGGSSGGKGGKTTPEYIPLGGSIDEQTKKVQELQKAWRAAADDDSRKKIKEQLEQAQLVMDVMNGKTKLTDITIKADTSEALEKLKGIDGITIDPKDVTIKADTSEALAKIQDIKDIDISVSSHSLPGLENELKELNDQRKLLSDPIDIELIDNQIKEVKDEIDQLNGKKVEIEIVPSTLTPFEQLKQSISIELAEENIKVDETTLKTLMQTAIQNGIDGLDPQFASLQEKMREGMDIPDSTWEDLQTQINEKLKELGIEPINIDLKTGNLAKDGNDITKAWRTAASAINTVGSAMSGLKNPAIDIMTVIGQSIASIALAYAENLAGDKTTKGNIWAFIAAAAAATVSMATTIASIHSSTGYAQGGIVKGNSYSGDNVPALVDGSQMVGLNAGEVVLTRAMQSNLAGQLQNGGNRIQVVGRLSGEQLFLCAERWSKRTGKGEFVTWR